MRHLQISDDTFVRVLKLSREKANAMNLAMLEEVIASLEEAGRDDRAKALIIASAQPRFFSTGFDVREVFEYDRPAMRHFFGRFMDLYESILRFPKPVIASLSGHAFAGGAILALSCDFRIMADGDYGFAINEINFGAVLPPAIRRMAIAAVGSHQARRLILTGETVKSRHALEIGLVDELAAEQEVLAKAIEWGRKLGSKPAAAFQFSKSQLLRDVGHPAAPEDRESLDVFLDNWFSPESSEQRRLLAEAMKR